MTSCVLVANCVRILKRGTVTGLVRQECKEANLCAAMSTVKAHNALQTCYNPHPFTSQRCPAAFSNQGPRSPRATLSRRVLPALGPVQQQHRGLGRNSKNQKPRAAELLYELADIDARTAATIASLLGPLLNVGQLLMIARIVLSWYPNINYGKLPWVLAVRPTEPILAPTRKVIPIVGGLDVTPIVWVALLSFINEILLGPQGILNLLQRKAEM